MSTGSRRTSRPPARAGLRTTVIVVIVLVFTGLGFERGWPIQALLGDLVAVWAIATRGHRSLSPLMLQAR